MVNYKYKYIKYKKKYLELKQKGGEVLSIISKKDINIIFSIDFNYAIITELIDDTKILNDSIAINLINNYDDYVDKNEEEEKEQQILDEQTEQPVQIGGEDEVNQDDINTNDEINDNENLQFENTDYVYPEDEEDDPINTLKEIDINSWKPTNTPDIQYYAIQFINDDKHYLLKLVSSNFKYEFKKNMEEYSDEYGKLMKMNNILAPLYLFKDEENIVCGYIFEMPKNFIDLNDYFKENDDIDDKIFLEILKGICMCFVNILKCNLKPCFKYNTLMINTETNEILLTGADGLLQCKNDIEEETIRDISKFINVDVISREIKKSYSFNKIFNYSNYGINLKNNITTIKGLLELINTIQKEHK